MLFTQAVKSHKGQKPCMYKLTEESVLKFYESMFLSVDECTACTILQYASLEFALKCPVLIICTCNQLWPKN